MGLDLDKDDITVHVTNDVRDVATDMKGREWNRLESDRESSSPIKEWDGSWD